MIDLAPIVFVTGKGGVGKTTVGAALALQGKRSGRPAALVEFGDGEAGTRSLGKGNREVDHVVVGFDDSLLDAVSDLLGSRTLAKILVGHSAMRRLIRAAPGAAELMKLDFVRRLGLEGKRGRIVVDLPASGHALGWLQVGRSIARFARVGPFHDMGKRIDDLVRDKTRSSIVVVTLAERLVLRETAELCATLAADLDRTPNLVVVNRVPPEDSEALGAAVRARAASDPHARTLERLLDFRRDARQEARTALNDATLLALAGRVDLPELATDPSVDELLVHFDRGGKWPS